MTMNTLARGWFVTGTDTGIGKTWTTLALMRAFQAKGLCTGGMKPVASGCEMTEDGLVNDDARSILEQSGTHEPYALINPYALKEPVAPHIAAARAGARIDMSHILSAYQQLAARHEIMLVEGAGGWRVPLTDDHFFPDLVRAMGIPVILVVGLRLGCINHALLTAGRIQADGHRLAGWVANAIDPLYGEMAETLEVLDKYIASPRLGVMEHRIGYTAANVPDVLTVEPLLERDPLVLQ